ncbi:MAG: hypothetical protein KAT16_00975 [Candidatus Heimdallarchaeota archaeon]|nr:hypothetical protein [Candidatus Heimdallarchaeota archaeon]
MRRDSTHYFIYPEYFDKSLKRSEGRRLPSDCSLDNPTWQEIRLAAEKLGLNCEIRKEGGYSRQWWDPKGLLLVEKKKSKLSTLRELSFEIEKNIRPALEKKKKELAEEKKKKKIKITKSSKVKKSDERFRPKRRR